MQKRLKILIVDDDPSVCEALGEVLERWGYKTSAARVVKEALDIIGKQSFDLVLCDVILPGMNGLEFLRKVKEMNPSLDVVMMTGFGNVVGAVQAIQQGAANYLIKPFPNQFLKDTIEKVLHKKQGGKNGIEKEDSLGNGVKIISQDPRMKEALKIVESVASSSAILLIQGETGTGKELLAKYLHHCSPRRMNSFLAINCAAIPKDLLESELFGHEKGSFTGAHERKVGKFEAANDGTLLLDEIGEMELGPQAKILRVLEEKEFFRVGGTVPIHADTRVVAATNRDLKELVHLGRFREDLYYRLNVIPVRITPLRERPDDIPLLVGFFLNRFSKENQFSNLSIEADALERLKRYSWPGNVRELENVILRAVITSPHGVIREQDILLDEDSKAPPEANGSPKIVTKLEDMEKRAIIQALRANHGNRTHAAAALGISLRTLRNKIRQYRDDGISL